MSATRHGNPGEWAKVKGTMMSLWPIFLCCGALGACGASLLMGRFQAVFAALFVVTVAVTAYLWRRGVRRVESYFKGARGEERVAALLDTLPDSWHVFHDFAAGGHHVDHVLVGATGIYAVETKNWRGRVTLDKNEILLDGNLPDRSPLTQTVRQADAVKAALKEAAPDCEVTPVLCLASDTFADRLHVAGRTTVLNAEELVLWILGRQNALASNEVERLAQLMETSI